MSSHRHNHHTGRDGPLRIGAVRYLNSKPLIEGLEEFAPFAQLRLDVPSRLADRLGKGELDVALIPSVESFLDPEYQVVSDACVATRGPVLSVKLYFRVPPGDVRTLAADEGSRTSVALSRVLLGERFGVEPELTSLPLGVQVSQTDADAVLLIGDRAMRPPSETFAVTWDLGEEWLRWTGLPFVFAMWVARPDVKDDRLSAALSAARDLGVSRIPEIAAREAGGLGLTESEAREYLQRNLHFQLGSAERTSLALFRDLADRQGLLKVSADDAHAPAEVVTTGRPSLALAASGWLT